MQNLINALNSGSPEFRDNGEVITRPPTQTMIRAAKTLAQLANINEQNSALLVAQQQTITQQLDELKQLREQLDAALHNLHEGKRETSSMGGDGGVNPASNPASETGTQS